MNPNPVCRIFSCVLLIVFACLAPKTFANHLAAMDIRADYIGSGPNDMKYKVTLTVYKACEQGNANLLDTEYYVIRSVSLNFQDTGMAITSRMDTVDYMCPALSSFNSCRRMAGSSSGPGYVRAVYYDTIVVPGRSADLTFYWKSYTRNYEVTNLQQYYGTYIECGINNTIRYNVSTPRYLSNPLAYTCVSQPSLYPNSPYSTQADSLVTYSRFSQDGPAIMIPFQFGYSITNPVGGNFYKVDSATGLVSFISNVTGKHVVGYRTDAYDRNSHTRISYATRDVQLAVLPCSSPGASISDTIVNRTGGRQLGHTNNIEVYADSTLSFDVISSSFTGTPPSLTSDHALTVPGSVFSLSAPGVSPLTGHFSWTPGAADTGLHVLTFTARDSACSAMQVLQLPGYLVVQIHVKKNLSNVGIPGTPGNSALAVYPNPAKNELYFTNDHIDAIWVLNIMGQSVLQVQQPGKSIDIASLPAGRYFVKMIRGKEVSIATFTKN